MKISNMRLTVTEKPVGCGYRYCISHYAAMGYRAFRTEKGLNEWLKSFELSVELIDEGISHHGENTGGWYKVYRVIGEVRDESFTDINQIPTEAIKITDLSNGSMVDCYISKVDGIVTIFRPNPNYKDIYKPLPIAEHRKIALAR